jgi:putative ABC transport system substrate-binding protein
MYTFKNLTASLLALPILLYFYISPSSSQTSPLKISILQIAEHPALNATREGLLDELKQLGYQDGKNVIVEYQSAQGNPTLAAQISQKFVADKADIIVAIATKAAQAAITAAKGTDIPVVFSSVTDPLGAKLVKDLKTPGKVATGVSNYIDVEPQFKLFKRLLPTLETLGIVYDSGEDNSIALNKEMEKVAKEMGLTLVFATVTKTSDVLAASQSLCGKVDAIFVNNDNTALSAFSSVVKAARSCDIPAFVSDIDIADQGAMAALGPDQVELGRQTARMVDQILKNPTTPLPSVEFPEKMREYIEKK